MRQIEVDVDVFSLIWANRKSPENNENEILRRVLREFGSTEPLKPTPRVSPLPPPPASTHESIEQFSSKNSNRKESEMLATAGLGKVRWVDDVVQALERLGGVASLHRIYREVEGIRRKAGRSTPKSLEATVRQTIESFSQDSDNFRGEDLFRKIARGEWALRDWAAKNLR